VKSCISSVSVLALVLVSLASADPINQVSYASLTGTQTITFDDVTGGGAPGTNYDAIFESGNTAFAERFVGQTRSTSGNFDTLSGTPSGPLALQVGAPGQNLNVFINGASQVLTGLGPLGFPDFDAIGEGSFALLFDFDQSEFGFELVGGDGGSAFVDFFTRDGSLINSITLGGLSSAFYGFSREGGVKDIAGISIYNTDAAGIGFDNLKHDVAGVPDGATVPEPSTFALLGLGLGALVFWRRRVSAM
jgi:PEP-CTERM motif/VPDSG-CTERM motif